MQQEPTSKIYAILLTFFCCFEGNIFIHYVINFPVISIFQLYIYRI